MKKLEAVDSRKSSFIDTAHKLLEQNKQLLTSTQLYDRKPSQSFKMNQVVPIAPELLESMDVRPEITNEPNLRGEAFTQSHKSMQSSPLVGNIWYSSG